MRKCVYLQKITVLGGGVSPEIDLVKCTTVLKEAWPNFIREGFPKEVTAELGFKEVGSY